MGLLSLTVLGQEEPARDALPERLPPRTATARKATDRITIDGKLDEASWKSADRLPIDMRHARGRTIEPAGYARVTWDNASFYVALEVLDKDIRAQGDGHDDAAISPPNDVAEVFIDINNDPEHMFEFHLNAVNGFNDFFIIRPRQGSPLLARARFGLVFFKEWNLKRYAAAVQVQGTVNKSEDVDQGWTGEIQLPFASLLMPLDQERPGTNDVWRVQMVIQDAGTTGHYVNWSPDYEPWYHHGIDQWGRVKFAE